MYILKENQPYKNAPLSKWQVDISQSFLIYIVQVLCIINWQSWLISWEKTNLKRKK